LSQLTAGASRVCIPLDDVCGDVYRSLPSLRAYLVIDPETSTVIAHLRDRRGSWASTTCRPGDVLALPCPDMLLNISDVFL
jgi:hypothetical protein